MNTDTAPLLHASETLLIESEEDQTTQDNRTDETECKCPIDENQQSKKYNLYVVYAEKDVTEVEQLCEELYQTYKLRCMLAARDFTPGVPIDKNCKDNMDKSDKTLILITPSYLSSYWCEVETRRAFHIVKSRKRDFVVPVLFKPLDEKDELPPCLEFTTYIDAAKEIDLARKIYEAYEHDVVHELTHEEIRKQNGARLFSVQCRKSNTESFRGSRWSFPAIENIFPLPDEPEIPEVYEDVRTILNESTALRWFGVFFTIRRLMLLGLSIGFHGFAVLPVIIGGMIIATEKYEEQMDIFAIFVLSIFVALGTGLMAIPVSIAIGHKAMRKTEREILSHCLRKKGNYPFLAVIRCASWRLQPDEINIIRYDIESCKATIQEFLNNQGDLAAEVLSKEDVVIFLEEFLYQKRVAMVNWISQIPFSCRDPHNTWKNKQCVCEMFISEYPSQKKRYLQILTKRTTTIVI
ncbi:hypothetical protein FSP39_001899 [Pinctada imbricata]|uniref:TIR domain-containing protein n=1 Tax=Pinctada imbricata TaxID=66713 RepID=A0AA88Y706_PINIB|nr:hypothetical protein FSP39_001899 [Pinctada imbricata]